MKERNRTCRAQLLLTYFHTGLLSLLKVTTNCLRLISQECAIEINALVNKVKETWFPISQFTLHCSMMFTRSSTAK